MDKNFKVNIFGGVFLCKELWEASGVLASNPGVSDNDLPP